jgi:hypothetical protein
MGDVQVLNSANSGCLPTPRARFSIPHQSLFFFNVPLLQFFPVASCAVPDSMQVEIENWTFSRIVFTAVGVGILSGLVFCAAATYLLPDIEERWAD